MKTIAIIALVGIAAVAFFSLSSGPSSDTEALFRDFMETYRTGYGSTNEYNYRLGVFADNLKRIDELNQANPEAEFGVNEFADRTPQEMEKMMGLIVPADKDLSGEFVAPVNIPDTDWTGLWSSVKDQGQCGSCWAFSATAAFEARSQIQSKKCTKLFAEQELVDCDKQSHGCNGGWMDYAFDYLVSNSFCEGSQYPYTARDGSCQVSKCAGGPKDSGHTDIPAKNENALLAELVRGPVSVAVDASSWSFYGGGVMSSCGKGLNHGVTLVASNNNEGWVKIRNSWGGSWGESGHIRLKAGQDTCGYADASSVPNF